jgi:hypothetical protein
LIVEERLAAALLAQEREREEAEGEGEQGYARGDAERAAHVLVQ